MLQVHENDHIAVRAIKAWLNINIAVAKAIIKGVIWLVTLQWLLG